MCDETSAGVKEKQPVSPFIVRMPEKVQAPLVVSIPHTGTYVPSDINDRFISDRIRELPMTDWHLHKLYDFLASIGVISIHATYSRFVVDLNRPPDSRPLYPGRFETGLVATRTFYGDDIWLSSPDSAEIEQRRALFHAPYHEKLEELLEGQREKFGQVFLIDAHSVSSKPSLLHGALTDDIYLGNRDGSSCEPWLIDTVASSMESNYLHVARNNPYKGGFITEHYGSLRATQALQIEMCQRVYMDEEDDPRDPWILKSPHFATARGRLNSMFDAVIEEILARI